MTFPYQIVSRCHPWMARSNTGEGRSFVRSPGFHLRMWPAVVMVIIALGSKTLDTGPIEVKITS